MFNKKDFPDIVHTWEDVQRRSQTNAFLLISNFFSHVFPLYGGAYLCFAYEYGHQSVSRLAVYI